MMDFIEGLRAKPEHVRRRIAFGTAAATSGVVAIVWIVTIVLSGSLALQSTNASATNNSTLAQTSGGQLVGAASQTKTAWSQMLGAVGAAFGASTSPAQINIEDAASATPPAVTTGSTAGSGGTQTSIPF